VHRGVHTLAARATTEYEDAREKVRERHHRAMRRHRNTTCTHAHVSARIGA
jgi:selenocysteine lyase/cysteine desulfurase